MFDDIRPYYDSEIPAAMKRIAAAPLFPALSSFVFPERDTEDVRKTVSSIGSIHDFQKQIMYPANRQIMRRSVSRFTYGGIGKIQRDRKHIYISNHRDIMLDASFLQSVLVDNGIDTTEITFGANLMQGELIIDIGKSNKMFRVERPGGSAREFYKSSLHLSEYIRTTILEKGQSVWIAQRNGRTKDGLDRTDQGIINMFRMSGPDDKVRSVAELGLLPVSISYEWEPCDIAKTIELYARRSGEYTKKEGEDINSILTGILQPKGHVHLEFCDPVSEADLAPYSHLKSNDFNRLVADIIDRRICSAYRLTPNNYIAHDMLSGRDSHASHYTAGQKEEFAAHLSILEDYKEGRDPDILEKIFLGIYANPVESMKKFTGNE